MVSPQSPRNIGESNSTASLFLGGVRRKWMGAVEPRREVPRPLPNDQVSIPPSVSPEDAVLMTPITPGDIPNPAENLSTAEKPDATLATTIPSPAPTISHPSPITADAAEDCTTVPPTVPPIVPPVPTRPVDGNDAPMAIRPNGTQRDPGAGGIASSVAQTGQTGQTVQAVQEGHMQVPRPAMPMDRAGLPSPAISEATWNEWLAQLEAMNVGFAQNGLLKPATAGGSSILKPRLDLLRRAISNRDSFYLVVHQVFCLYTIDPSSISHIGASEQGVQTLTSLLEDNHKMHFSATFRLAHFPDSPERLLERAWYQHTIKSVPLFLAHVAHRWIHSWASSNRPPLVTDMVKHFALPSPVMMSVMFTCVSRHLHKEQYVGHLQRHFWGDWMFWQTQQPPERIRTHDEMLIREYLKFPRLPQDQRQTVHPNRPVATRPADRAQIAAPSPVPDITQTMVPHSSPAAHPVPSPPIQAAHPRPAGQTPPLGGNIPVQALEGSHVPQYLQGPSLVYGFDGVSHQMQSPQSSQSPQLHSAQAQILAQRHIQALRYGQVPPSNSQMGIVWGPRVGHFSQPSVPNPANSAHSSPTAFTPPQPLPNTQSPLPPSTLAHSGHNTSQVVSQLSQRSSHQRSPGSHLPLVSSAQTAKGVHSSQASHFPHPPPLPHSTHPPPPQSRLSSPLFPAPGYRAPVTVNGDPMRLGLHLANLRDPMKKLVRPGPDGQLADTELFVYFGDFLIPPCLIKADEPSYTWKFRLNDDDFRRFPYITEANGTGPATWTYQPGNRTIRLRCISHAGDPKSFDHDTWITSTTFWPSVFYINVNGTELQVRRKVQHLKDLALDITKNLKMGENSIRIDLILGKDECKKIKYFFAVEVMEVTSFEGVLGMVQPISAAESRADIVKRLAPLTEDEDLAVVTDNLTINLVDPFTARVFDIPARSRKCTHSECFDRDTFIKTRESVSGPTPMIEEWKCPICKTDARPQLLVVDRFLAEVHEEVVQTNRLEEAKAIQIKADGTWTLKVNSDEASSETSKSPANPDSLKRKAPDSTISEHVAVRPKQEPSKQQPPSAPSRSHEIIELD
ncbi:unnamed protein product [Penicillium salamii]|uniref:SP-RING-type domain-containing protein n=1 Tax=Penicillium salamii TaxID=1612424 RepID=A0A9W4J0S5_9EURO|nr:unnamed protein product [Penicillium salamii]CAG8250719.1 unnamed protein product [Penicillium salamii]CAG8366659.1 unnamed protein product [Penicillium salamii]CAG8390739.1 unnamed protein product [Penicillium salamii]CAG8392565.1 unnamed protein product [Penicillium salamii]